MSRVLASDDVIKDISANQLADVAVQGVFILGPIVRPITEIVACQSINQSNSQSNQARFQLVQFDAVNYIGL